MTNPRTEALAGDAAVDRLRMLVGADAVSTEDSVLRSFAGDMTENAPVRPDAVVRIANVERLQEIVRLASELRIPVTPRVAGTNIGGLAIPARGGWVLDLRAMNRILALDPENMIAVLEPGVTFGQLAEALEGRAPGLTTSYPLAPPEASVVANCLLDGLGNLSLRHGTTAESIAGVEVVRGDGTLLRTGVGALGVPVPFSRAPLPDLTGLFVSWQGVTGIVANLALQLWPAPRSRWRAFVFVHDRRAVARAMSELPRLDVLDDLGALSWPAAKMLLGVPHPRERDPAEPELFLFIDVGAATAGLLREKRRVVEGFVADLRGDGIAVDDPIDVESLLSVEPRLGKLARFPTRLDFLLDHPDGGLTWVGTYGPPSRFDRACEAGIAIVERHGFVPTIVARAMKGGHFVVLRFVTMFRHDDEAHIERVRACNAELCDGLLEEGFVMYKAPAWAAERYAPRLDSGFARVLREVRSVLDPYGILGAGRWDPWLG